MTEYTDKLIDSIAGKTQSVTYERAIEYVSTYHYATAIETQERIDRRYSEGKGDSGLTRSMERAQARDQARAEAQMELVAMMFARDLAEVEKDVADKYNAKSW